MTDEGVRRRLGARTNAVGCDLNGEEDCSEEDEEEEDEASREREDALHLELLLLL